MNPLRETLVNIRVKYFVRVICVILYIVGYTLVYRVGGWPLFWGVFMINMAFGASR